MSYPPPEPAFDSDIYPGITQVTASGDAYQVGSSHGAQAADLIAAGLDQWRAALTQHGRDPEQLITDLSERAGFWRAVERHLPWLAAELEAIAAGAGQDVRSIFATNCLDEAWWWGTHGAACSVVAVSGHSEQPGIAGQTMDLDTWMDGTQVALRLAPDNAPQQVLLSRAGMVGLCGANEAGLVVLVNTLEQLPVDPDGVPVAFMLRALLAQRSVDDAVGVLHQLPHASGQSYTLVSRKVVRGFECGAGVVVEYINDVNDPMRRWHTNHPLAYRGPLDHASEDPVEWATTSSQPRLAQLAHTLGATPEVNADDLEAWFSDTESGICMFPGRWRDDGFTFGSIIAELDGGVRVRIAAGPPDRNPYVDVGFVGSRTNAR